MGAVGIVGSNRRYRRSSGLERQRLQWFGWAVAVGLEVLLLAVAARLLVGWPDDAIAIVGAATFPFRWPWRWAPLGGSSGGSTSSSPEPSPWRGSVG